VVQPHDDSKLDSGSHADVEGLYANRLKECRRQAVRSGGDVSPEAIESLSRLAKLVQLSRESAASRHVLIVCLAALSLAISSVLLFAHVSETEIDLKLEVSGATFVLARPQVLTDVMVLPFVGVSGLREIKLPSAQGRAPQSWSLADLPNLSVGFAPDPSTKEGSVTLAPLQLAEYTRVTLQRQGPPYHYRMSLSGRKIEPSVDLYGSVQIRRSDAAPATVRFSTPDTVVMQTASDTVDLDLVFEGTQNLSPELTIRELSLARVEDFRGSQSLVRRVSNIRSGTLYLEALDGKAHTLRPGESIELFGLSGEIEPLSLDADAIRLEFRGRVTGAVLGTGEGRRSVMPTSLEWLRARHGLTLFWATATYVFGLVLAAFRFWRTPL
jgi:hypothetical protein